MKTELGVYSLAYIKPSSTYSVNRLDLCQAYLGPVWMKEDKRKEWNGKEKSGMELKIFYLRRVWFALEKKIGREENFCLVGRKYCGKIGKMTI